MQPNDEIQKTRFTRTLLPQASTTPTPQRGPSPMNGAIAQANARRIERTGGQGLYEQAYADLADLSRAAREQAFPNTITAFRGASRNIGEAYQTGGIPATIGATVRNTMVPAIGLADDLGSSFKRALDPAANALKAASTGDYSPIDQPAVSTLRSTGPDQAQPARRGAEQALQSFSAATEQRDAAGDGKQQVRGTNISAARQPNGTMAFSGAAPTFAAPAFSRSELPPSTDSLAQEFSARADRMRALREENTALRDNLNFNAGGALSRQKTQDEITRDMLTGQSRSGRQAAVQLMEDQQRAGIERQRTAIDQQRADADRMTAEASVNVSRAELDQQRRIRGLQDRLIDEQDPGKRAQFERTLGIISGKDNSGQPQVIYNEELINPEQPMAGTRRVPMLLNRDGTATVVTPRATPNAPDGMRYVGTSNGKPVYEDQNGRRFVQGGN